MSVPEVSAVDVAAIEAANDENVFCNENTSGRFRLRCRNLFLTYPHCDGEPEAVAKRLSMFFAENVVKFMIGVYFF
jgi:hypothetical protein